MPASSASTGISIFIDSRIATVSPSSIVSPTAHSIFHTVPVMWASTSAMSRTSWLIRVTVGENSLRRRSTMASNIFVIVTAHNEADRIGATLAALAAAFPGAPVWVADDGSTDATARDRSGGRRAGGAQRAGDRQGRRRHPGRPGGPAPRAGGGSRRMTREAIFILCDGDLGESAASSARSPRRCAAARRTWRWRRSPRASGAALGLAVGFARWAIRRRCGLRARRRSPASARCARAALRRRAAVRARLRHGDRDDDRRRPRRTSRRRDRARPRPPRHRPHARRVRPPRAPARRLRARLSRLAGRLAPR